MKQITPKEIKKSQDIKKLKKISSCGVARINTDNVRSPSELFTCWLQEVQTNGCAKPLICHLATVTRFVKY